MERLDKIKLAIEKGITCNPETGIVYGVKGNKLIRKVKGRPCFNITHNNKNYTIPNHHFIFYTKHEYDVRMIDHINENICDNRIDNLRETTKSQNSLNTSKTKGITYEKRTNKWLARLQVNGVNKSLGYFKSKEDAMNTYQLEKQKYI
jgi:hypothetical protein